MLFLLKAWQYRVEDIDNATPNELKPYIKAMDVERDYHDEIAWNIGLYSYIAHGKVLGAAFSTKKGKKGEFDYPDLPVTQQIVKREMTKEEFEALPPEEKEKIFMQVIDKMMAPAIQGFKRKKELEEKENG